MMNIVYVMTDDDPFEPYTDYTKKVALYVLEQERRDNVSCSIVAMSSSSIVEYNKTYRHKDYVPDVLTFVDCDSKVPCLGNTEDDEERDYLGDILICMSQIQQQAKEHTIDVIEELTRIIIHGILHVLGYTHDTYNRNEPMLILQEKLLHGYIDRTRGVL